MSSWLAFVSSWLAFVSSWLVFVSLFTVFVSGCTGTIAPITYPVMPAALTPVDAEHNKAKDFARVFCSTLPHLKDQDGRGWGECGRYLEMTDTAQPQTAIASRFRFLVIPGFGAECFKDTRAFSSSIAHLVDDHQVDIRYFAVAPFASSEENGKSIARQLEAEWPVDKTKKFILIGYGKGATDSLEALRVVDEPKAKVAAIVSVAGVVGGTWVPDEVVALMRSQPWIAGNCPANVEDGLHSLRREVRQSFLRQNPTPVPAYSIVGTTSFDETSSVLRPTWKRLSYYAKEQDGVMIAWEALLPSAKYLGAARADHWAIALPFDEASQPSKKIDRNRYPRDALLEAIVRYVSGDLAATPAGGS